MVDRAARGRSPATLRGRPPCCRSHAPPQSQLPARRPAQLPEDRRPPEGDRQRSKRAPFPYPCHPPPSTRAGRATIAQRSVIVTSSSQTKVESRLSSRSAAGRSGEALRPSAIVAATPTLSDRSGAAMGILSRASAAAATASGTPADSRPTSRMSSGGNQSPTAPSRPSWSGARACGRMRLASPRIEARSRGAQATGIRDSPCRPGETGVADAKAGRLDDRRVDAETGASTHDRAGVLGDVRLV